MLNELNMVCRDMAAEHYKRYRRFLSEEDLIKHIVVYLLSSDCNCQLWRLMDNLNNSDFHKVGSPILEFN